MKQGIFLRKIEANSKDAIIDIIGEIGWEVSFPILRDMITAIPDTVERVIFEIYSPGGDVWEGNGIIQQIGKLKQKTLARVQVAASMATLIAVACQEREIAANGRWLIHNPWTQLAGDADALEKRAKELRDCEAEAAEFYARRTGQSVEAIRALMAEERWLTPAEAKSLGFVQAINDPFDQAAFAAVKSELEKAGKWPKALCELPDAQPPSPAPAPATTLTSAPTAAPLTTQEDPNDNAITVGTKGTGGTVVDGTPKPADDPLKVIEEAGYQRGLAAGESARAAMLTAHAEAIAKREEMIRAHQSARDKAEGKVKELNQALTDAATAAANARAALVKEHEQAVQALAENHAAALAKQTEQIEQLTKTLKDANDQLNKLLGGGMAFEPAPVETWEEAMQLCHGDYAAAARKYPKLRDEYIRKHARK